MHSCSTGVAVAAMIADSGAAIFYLPPPWVTKYCIQSCHTANAIIANAVATVTNSMTFSVNLLYRCVNSCTNIAIFFPSSSVVYTASNYLGLPSTLQYYAAAIDLPLEDLNFRFSCSFVSSYP